MTILPIPQLHCLGIVRIATEAGKCPCSQEWGFTLVGLESASRNAVVWTAGLGHNSERVYHRVVVAGLILWRPFLASSSFGFTSTQHVVRAEGLTSHLITGNYDSRRTRGRPRTTWLSNTADTLRTSTAMCVKNAQNRTIRYPRDRRHSSQSNKCICA